MKIFAATKRFILREITPEDIQEFYTLDSDPEVHKYLGNQPVQNIEESEKMIASICQQYHAYGIARWGIVDKETQAFLGWGGLKYETAISQKGNYYDLGYRLKKKYWGKGVATEVAKAALQYGFDVLQLDKICAAAAVDNIASNKVLVKIGLKHHDTFTYKNTRVNWYEIQQKK